MAEIPTTALSAYTKGVNEISKRSADVLEEMLDAIDWSQDITAVKHDVMEAMQTCCGTATDLAAILSSEFYDYVRELEVGEPLGAVAESRTDPVATDEAVGAFTKKLIDGLARSAYERYLRDRLDYETKRAAGECMYANGERDPRRPRFARVPTGFETCSFCIMLASRGFVYHSRQTAGDDGHYHANCDCRIVPGWDGDTKIAGYDPDRYYDMWKNPAKYPELREARNARRRELRAQEKERAQVLNSEPIRIITAGRAVGAKALNDYVIHIPGMEDSRFFPESDIEAKKVFAGAGSDPPVKLRVAQRLSKTYGDDPENWSHVAGVGWMFDPADGKIRRAEVHWMESPEAGIQEVYWKRWIEPE